MPDEFPALTEGEIARLFPLERDPINPPAFEVGIALAGTVSAGAYTAGVLDYLIEALDAWTAAKAKGDPSAPPHRVAISTVAGASGGAINGAILLRAAGFDFPHGAVEGNPFYAAWAGNNCVTIDRLLAPGLPKFGAGPLAALNTTAIEDQAGRIINFPGNPIAKGTRDYLADPLRLIATIGNLGGIPYEIPFAGQSGLGLTMVAHDDTVRFALAVPHGATVPDQSRQDEYALASTSPINWNLVQAAVLATSAFPAAFDLRAVDRTAFQYVYRTVTISGDGAAYTSKVVALTPRWNEVGMTPPSLSNTAYAVDGGTMNNEPIDLVRRALAGAAGRNDRSATNANRATFLIDPFAGRAAISARPTQVLALLRQILGLYMEQARYRPEDLALVQDESVFSRFLVAPFEWNESGSKLLGAGKLYGFSGFLDRSYLQHDFALGRYDAFLFLSRDFRFPENNIVFQSSPWSADQKKEHTSGVYDFPNQDPATASYLPMIPLMAALRNSPPTAPSAPAPVTLPDDLEEKIRARLDFVFARLLPEIAGNSVPSALINLAWKTWASGKISSSLFDAIKSATGASPGH